MGEERLIEITTEISRETDTLWIMAYVASLSPSDIHLFCNYLKNPKYKGMNICSAIIQFSNDYLASKKIALERTKTDEVYALGQGEVMEQSYDDVTYLQAVMASSSELKTRTGGRSGR